MSLRGRRLSRASDFLARTLAPYAHLPWRAVPGSAGVETLLEAISKQSTGIASSLRFSQ